MKKKTVLDFIDMKKKGEPIAWLTAYDYPSAYALEQAGIDLILVGDSGIMCQYGEDSTIPSTMEDQIRMTKAVRKGAPNTFIVGDMPFGSYEVSIEEGVRNALRLVKEGDCDAIKFEGYRTDLARAMTNAGIVVFGHLGLTPQSSAQLGGYRVQRNADKIYKEMADMWGAGAGFMLVEAVPSDFNYQEESKKWTNPHWKNAGAQNQIVFGIGAGKNVDGQLLIYHDIVGYYPNFKPRFAKNYWQSALELTPEDSGMLKTVQTAAELYIREVKEGLFPSEEYMYKPKEDK
jgi:3-methyl-2-oxobutanoate hydroxymethyltransferase